MRQKDYATAHEALRMLKMFREESKDTAQIAAQFQLPESVVYNALEGARAVESIRRR